MRSGRIIGGGAIISVKQQDVRGGADVVCTINRLERRRTTMFPAPIPTETARTSPRVAARAMAAAFWSKGGSVVVVVMVMVVDRSRSVVGQQIKRENSKSEKVGERAVTNDSSLKSSRTEISNYPLLMRVRRPVEND